MMGWKTIIAILFLLLLTVSYSVSGSPLQHKILYVDSYHESYDWSAGITRGIQSVLNNKENIELQIVRMDTKRNPSENHMQSAALNVKGIIETWHPDVVIASDDNASRYLIVPYYKETQLPFVFCGVNWDAGGYGFPLSNVTGMLEVQLVDKIIETLRVYAKGERVALLKGDDRSARIEARFFEERCQVPIDKRFVTTFSEWKHQYLELQTEADMILVGNSASISDWNNTEALQFVMDNTQVPTGNWDSWMAPFALVTFANKAEEQGEWAARTALQILAGTSPSDIPITTNEKATVFLNMKLAKTLGIKFPLELIERATFTTQ